MRNPRSRRSGTPSIGMFEALKSVWAEPVLLAGLTSRVGDATVAVFSSDPPEALTVTTMVTVTDEPAAIVPTFAVTVLPAGGAQEPCVVEQETKVVPDGSGSVSTTAAALAGPPFETTIV